MRTQRAPRPRAAGPKQTPPAPKKAASSPPRSPPRGSTRGVSPDPAGKRPAAGPPPGPGPKRQRTYGEGTHGFKTAEQTRLGKKYGASVTGATHESEHTVGYDVLAKPAGLNRKTDGAHLEKLAPAYQEQKPFHRAHIGTGNKTSSGPEDGGWNSAAYRRDQRTCIEAGDVSSAVQLNQLGYAHNPRFKTEGNTIGRQQANDSFDSMVTHNHSLTYAKADGTMTQVPIDARQKAEMYLSRPAAQNGRFPTVAEENEARLRFGLPPATPTKTAST